MISVCLASYNGEKYIYEQIESILKQLSENDELIISDDGSTDNTIGIIESFKDNRIRVIFNTGKNGYTSNFYNALKEVKGDYIFLSDQDDVWVDNKVGIVMEYLKDYNFVHTNAKIINENGEIICESRNVEYGVKNGYIHNLLKSRYLGCCMAFDKKVLKSLFPVPVYDNKYPHDLWIALIAERYFKTILLDEKLIMYRRHFGNFSNGGESEKYGFIALTKKIFCRVYYIFYVVKQKKYIDKEGRNA